MESLSEVFSHRKHRDYHFNLFLTKRNLNIWRNPLHFGSGFILRVLHIDIRVRAFSLFYLSKGSVDTLHFLNWRERLVFWLYIGRASNKRSIRHSPNLLLKSLLNRSNGLWTNKPGISEGSRLEPLKDLGPQSGWWYHRRNRRKLHWFMHSASPDHTTLSKSQIGLAIRETNLVLPCVSLILGLCHPVKSPWRGLKPLLGLSLAQERRKHRLCFLRVFLREVWLYCLRNSGSGCRNYSGDSLLIFAADGQIWIFAQERPRASWKSDLRGGIEAPFSLNFYLSTLRDRQTLLGDSLGGLRGR